MSDVAPVSLNSTLGALLIGQIVSTTFWGCGTLQAFYYFDSFPEDKLHLKLLVLSVWILDTAHQGCVAAIVYTYCIIHFGDYSYIQQMPYALWFMLLFSAVIAIIVQSFLVYRVYILSGRKIALAVFADLFVVEQFIAVISLCIFSHHEATYSELFRTNIAPLVITIASASSDFVLAVLLVYLLHRSASHSSHIPVPTTETVIHRLILFVINSSVLTSTCMILSLITFLALPNDLVYLAFYMVVSKLYANTLYATLNFRNRVRRPLSLSVSSRSRSESVASARTAFSCCPHATTPVHRLSALPRRLVFSCDGKLQGRSRLCDYGGSDGNDAQQSTASSVKSTDIKKSNDSPKFLITGIESVHLPTISRNYSGDGVCEIGKADVYRRECGDLNPGFWKQGRK